MPRTTVDIDASVLRELKRRGRQEGKSLGQLISEIAAVALKRDTKADVKSLRWHSRPMAAQVDLDDKEALNQALDGR